MEVSSLSLSFWAFSERANTLGTRKGNQYLSEFMLVVSDKREHIPVSGPSRKAYIMLDESYEASNGVALRRQGSWREKEVQRRKNHNLGLAQHLGRRRQSWMSGGLLCFFAARCAILFPRSMELTPLDMFRDRKD